GLTEVVGRKRSCQAREVSADFTSAATVCTLLAQLDCVRDSGSVSPYELFSYTQAIFKDGSYGWHPVRTGRFVVLIAITTRVSERSQTRFQDGPLAAGHRAFSTIAGGDSARKVAGRGRDSHPARVELPGIAGGVAAGRGAQHRAAA